MNVWLVHIKITPTGDGFAATMVGDNLSYQYSRSKYAGVATWPTREAAIVELTAMFPNTPIL